MKTNQMAKTTALLTLLLVWSVAAEEPWWVRRYNVQHNVQHQQQQQEQPQQQQEEQQPQLHRSLSQEFNSHHLNDIVPSQPMIPGRVEPSHPERPHATASQIRARPNPIVIRGEMLSSSTVAPNLSITTYHPPSHNIPANALVGGDNIIFPAYKFVPVFKPVPAFKPMSPIISRDGGLTIKSRVESDTLVQSANSVIKNDNRYTTLDKLFRERGNTPPQQDISKSKDLGGLDPKEVFYADDDLLIIKGGGFPTATYQQPPQPLDEPIFNPEEELGVSSRFVEVIAPPPSIHEEYNGNIPSIVAPPPRNNQINHHPQSHQMLPPFRVTIPQFLQSAVPARIFHIQPANQIRHNGHFQMPYLYQAPQTPFISLPPPPQFHQQSYIQPHFQQYIRPVPHQQEILQHQNFININRPLVNQHYLVTPHRQPQPLNFQNLNNNPVISLADDTRVNYLDPLPPINTEAEILPSEAEFSTSLHYAHPPNRYIHTSTQHKAPIL